MTTQNTVQCKS